MLILGSGLGALSEHVEEAVSVPYGVIPHFARSTAPGHAGHLVLGRLAGRPVAVMVGRSHLYEGYSPTQIVLPIQALQLLGSEIMIVTNAAGGVNPQFRPGTLMVIRDHINLTGRNPLVGVNDDRLGTRFPDMTEAYDVELRSLAMQVAAIQRLPLAEGVYLGLLGPSFETPAEIRMARLLGADAVGMSTVMEVIAARHAGMRVFGLSVITNLAAGMSGNQLTEDEVIETATAVRDQVAALIQEIVRRIGA